MSPLDMEPDMEDDTLDQPAHVRRFEDLLGRYQYGLEPLNSWRAQDVAHALACLHRELVERGAEIPTLPEKSDDGI